MKIRTSYFLKKNSKKWIAKFLTFLLIFSSFEILGDMSHVKANGENNIRTLNYADSPADNPIKGFAGFRGTGAYSDFPSSIEYITMPVSDIVVGEGQYNWNVLESYLNEIASYGRQSIVSFFLDSPGTEIGVNAIPKYLLDSGLKVTEYTMGSATSSDIDIGYSPDYSNRKLWEMAYNFVDALGRKYDGDARIASIEASIVGIWAEWHTSPYDFGLEDSDLIQLAKKYDNAFNKTLITIRYPKSGTNQLDVGYSDYSFCYESIVDPWSQLNRLIEYNATEYWKTNIGGGELFPSYVNTIFETPNWSLKDGESYGECLQALHPSWLLVGSVHTFTGNERNEAIKASRKLGYDLTVTQAEFAQNITSSTNNLDLSLKIKNIGVAPFYYNWKVKVGILNEEGELIKKYSSNWDITKIAANANEYEYSGRLSNLALQKGLYSLAIYVENPMLNGKKFRFANETQRADGWMVLGDFSVDGYEGSGTNPPENLPTAYDKYRLDVSATDFPEIKIKSGEPVKVGLRIRNYGTSKYNGTDTPVLSFYKDGTLVKQINTDWNLSKINPDSNNYYAWFVNGLGIGKYDIKIKITSDTRSILLGRMNIVNSLDDLIQPEEPLSDSGSSTVPTAKEKYNLDVTQTDVPSEAVISDTGTKVGVRICNYASSNYAGTERPIMNIYNGEKLVKQIITNWDLTKINTNEKYYFSWYVKGLAAGTYTVKLRITSDTQEITLGNMKLISYPTAKDKYNLDVTQIDLPKEDEISDTGTKVGVRICNYASTNYAGTEHPIIKIYKNGIFVKQSKTNWDLTKINTNVNYYFSWYIKGLVAGTYTVKLQITSDTQEIFLGNMKLTSLPTAKEKYQLDITQIEVPAESAVTNQYVKVGVRICNYASSNYAGTDHPILSFYKDGVIFKQIITNWDLTKINTNQKYYFCWYVKGLTVGSYTVKMQITTDTQVITLGNMNIIAAKSSSGSNENQASFNIAKEIPIKNCNIKIKAGKTKNLNIGSIAQNVNWKSSNKSYATINNSGILKAKKASNGKSIIITATNKNTNKKVAVYNVIIKKNLIQKIKVRALKSQRAGKKVKIKISYKPSSYIYKKCSFKSSNKKYATVNKKGIVKLKKAGKGKIVKITVKTLDGSKIKKVIKIKIL
ncbi:DUF4832 domain-containing protein [Anaerosacchariphilus polymeriproducens]|uniref:DUF4832 domain-containing protein n=1 Tax=Anaerosacchariphilus polymeriproducens TaxID=1812858 RepID=A0A371AZ74_9FIRM|nr:DUF4832 domain-containing protein [Anaerosacchariphilus polymeriproducens]RDU24780.1 DUF4832 domain-containing protein [Anaerosacchariphilus polymeriproducens]